MRYRSIVALLVAATSFACSNSGDVNPAQPSTLTSSLASSTQSSSIPSQVPSVLGTWSGTRTVRFVNQAVFNPQVNLCQLSLSINSQNGSAFFGSFVSHGIGNVGGLTCDNTGTFNGFIVAGGLRFVIPFTDFQGCVGTPDGIFVAVMPSFGVISAQSSGCGTPVSFFVNRR